MAMMMMMMTQMMTIQMIRVKWTLIEIDFIVFYFILFGISICTIENKQIRLTKFVSKNIVAYCRITICYIQISFAFLIVLKRSRLFGRIVLNSKSKI